MNRNYRSVREHLADRDLTNRKPYRTAKQKAVASDAVRIVDGRHVAKAPVTHHHIARKGD